MIKDWDGCRKEECNLWEVAGVASCCRLHGRYSDRCENTGEFFTPKKVEPVVEYEGVKCFTILDMAQAGICHEKISKFFREHFSNHDNNFANHTGTSMSYEVRSEELAKCGLTEDLERHGFIRRKVPDLNVLDFVTWENDSGSPRVGIIEKAHGDDVIVLCLSRGCFKTTLLMGKDDLTKIEIP